MTEWSPDVARLQAHDDAEWLAVERTYCGRLAAYVARRIPDRDAREDVIQETFLGAVRGIDDFDPIYTFEQYLFGICRNRIAQRTIFSRIIGCIRAFCHRHMGNSCPIIKLTIEVYRDWKRDVNRFPLNLSWY